jgi:hypothetical protein
MMTYKINGEFLTIPYSQDELAERVGKGAAIIKTMVGIGNNAAWSCCLEALDHLRKHPNYRHRVKQGFKAAIEVFNAYERRLIYASENRLFCVNDLTPEYRKKYGNITDREYYDFWASTGATAYTQKRMWVTNLWNKFRLSLIAHKIPNVEAVAWGMTADACLKLAICIYENSIKTCVIDYDVPKLLLEAIFGQLNIAVIEKRWDDALVLLEPLTATYDLTELEQKNIQLGLDQLQDEWTSVATLTGSLTESIEAYGEVFRTQGEQKKALRQVAEMRD